MTSRTSFDLSISGSHADRWETIATLLTRLKGKNKDKAIHEIRLEIKKLMAFYDFVAYCDRDFDPKLIKPLHAVFHQLGEYRDHHNHLKLCAKFNISKKNFGLEEAYVKHIPEQLHAATAQELAIFDEIKTEAHAAFTHCSYGRWQAYLHKKKKKIAKALTKEHKPTKLHELRKKIKHFIFNTDLLPHRRSRVITKDVHDRLDEFQDQIGKWHDLRAFAQTLKTTGYSKEHKENYQLIKTKVKKKHRKVLHLQQAISAML